MTRLSIEEFLGASNLIVNSEQEFRSMQEVLFHFKDFLE